MSEADVLKDWNDRGTIPRGSSQCPVCGLHKPHGHHDDEIGHWVEAQASRFGLKAIVYRGAAAKDEYISKILDELVQDIDDFGHENPRDIDREPMWTAINVIRYLNQMWEAQGRCVPGPAQTAPLAALLPRLRPLLEAAADGRSVQIAAGAMLNEINAAVVSSTERGGK